MRKLKSSEESFGARIQSSEQTPVALPAGQWFCHYCPLSKTREMHWDPQGCWHGAICEIHVEGLAGSFLWPVLIPSISTKVSPRVTTGNDACGHKCCCTGWTQFQITAQWLVKANPANLFCPRIALCCNFGLIDAFYLQVPFELLKDCVTSLWIQP